MHTVLKPLYARIELVGRGRAVLSAQGNSCVPTQSCILMSTELLPGRKSLLTCWYVGQEKGGDQADTVSCSVSAAVKQQLLG